MLKIAANQVIKKVRALNDAVKLASGEEAGGGSNDGGPAGYYVQGRYNGD